MHVCSSLHAFPMAQEPIARHCKASVPSGRGRRIPTYASCWLNNRGRNCLEGICWHKKNSQCCEQLLLPLWEGRLQSKWMGRTHGMEWQGKEVQCVSPDWPSLAWACSPPIVRVVTVVLVVELAIEHWGALKKNFPGPNLVVSGPGAVQSVYLLRK